MSVFSEFRAFIQRGNVVDLAVGVIMGAEFGKIVSSLVGDLIMPPIGYVIGGVSFKDLQYTLPKIKIPTATGELELAETSIRYGQFLQNCFNFLIIAVCVFFLVKAVNLLNRKAEAATPPPAPSNEEKLLVEIRDLLRDRR